MFTNLIQVFNNIHILKTETKYWKRIELIGDYPTRRIACSCCRVGNMMYTIDSWNINTLGIYMEVEYGINWLHDIQNNLQKLGPSIWTPMNGHIPLIHNQFYQILWIFSPSCSQSEIIWYWTVESMWTPQKLMLSIQVPIIIILKISVG